jgi:hypothetical protein
MKSKNIDKDIVLNKLKSWWDSNEKKSDHVPTKDREIISKIRYWYKNKYSKLMY